MASTALHSISPLGVTGYWPPNQVIGHICRGFLKSTATLYSVVNPVYHPMIRYAQYCLAAHSYVASLIGERDIYQCVQINDVH